MTDKLNLFQTKLAVNQKFKFYETSQIKIDIKREDLLHQQVSGNKLRKLKYNLREALYQNQQTVLTYGGAYSNHIAATAAACHIIGLECIGVIRGEELGQDLHQTLRQNTTLATALSYGMKFNFVSREDYRLKDTAAFQQELRDRFGDFYNIPEGGTNALAVLGTREILSPRDLEDYEVICVAAGTGGTAAGIIESAAPHQKVLVFSALKGDFLREEILKYTSREDFTVISENVFGGYARSSDVLIDYLNFRFRESKIPLDPIYTGKMMYRIEEMLRDGAFTDKTRILAIHTGGLQSIPGFNDRLSKKGRLQLDYEDEI